MNLVPLFTNSNPLVSAEGSRLALLGAHSPASRERVKELLGIARHGLSSMHRNGRFAHTMRGVRVGPGLQTRLEGESLRYTAMVALGLSKLDLDGQRSVLGDLTAADLAQHAAARAELSDDAGAIALAVWASAEAGGVYAGNLMRRLDALMQSGSPVDTVDCSWILCAGIAALNLGETRGIVERSRALLLAEQSRSGLFPHRLPNASNDRMRRHVGCFADQVYPIQALSRFAAITGDESALVAADRCAARICALQGEDGQWWWHYDTRDGSVVEGYPVYSVHQHAMAPMALLDLRAAGGTDYISAIEKGLRWLDSHPEKSEDIVSPSLGVVWRKIARREPPKATRTLSALTTGLKPGFRLPGLNLVFPPAVIDYECRPYEFGWMLYAWFSTNEAG